MRGRGPVAAIGAIAVLMLVAAVAHAQSAAPVTIAADALNRPGGLELRNDWRYRPGDDDSWKDPSLDDTDWEVIGSPRMVPASTPKSGWPGIGWFRLRVTVDDALVDSPLALVMDHPGASEVFVDGQRIGGFGTVGATRDAEKTYNPSGQPLTFTLDRAGEHVLAVRYSCISSTTGILPRLISAGFYPTLKRSEPAFTGYLTDLSLNIGINAFLATLMLAFGVLHLLLFLFHRSQRANLYYGIFAVLFGLLILSGFIRPALHLGYDGSLAIILAGRLLVGGVFLFLVAFLKSAFSFPFTWRFRVLVVFWIVAIIASVLFPTVWIAFQGINFAVGLSLAEAMFTIGWALRHKLYGAWLIGLGAHSIAIALTAQLVAMVFGIQSIWTQAIALVGFFGLPLCVSVFFARHVAQTNRTLEAKLAEVEQLSEQTLEHERRAAELRVQREQERAHVALLQAENDRKAKELEEARQLQLSMLPRTLPVVPGVEIAAYMKPATEVGGDYYDFHVGPDGTLTIAVGDATGHGLKAGTLVTATKGLFNAFALEPDIVATFHRSSLALKQLNLRYLYMALTLVKLNGRTIRVGAAGMPPMLVWRAATGQVDEIALPGLPLGGAARFPYEEREVILSDGDTVVMMSDGFPERFNEVGEMIDYERAAGVLREAAGESPQAIIERFVAEGDAWAGIRPQDDDITCVVLRFGDPEPRAVL